MVLAILGFFFCPRHELAGSGQKQAAWPGGLDQKFGLQKNYWLHSQAYDALGKATNLDVIQLEHKYAREF